jgi:hypothetical protein
MERDNVISTSKSICQKLDNKPDAGGNYGAFPIQFFFLITHGVNTNGHIELIRGVRHITDGYIRSTLTRNLKISTNLNRVLRIYLVINLKKNR